MIPKQKKESLKKISFFNLKIKVFLLQKLIRWRGFVLIDANKHLVLTAEHPSPLARGAFFGSKHFSKTNEFLKRKGIEEVEWGLG